MPESQDKPCADPDRQQPLSPGSMSAGSIISFEQIAAGRSEVVIEYRGQQYRLRTTRNGGLILNK